MFTPYKAAVAIQAAPKINLRTRPGREAEVLAKIANEGGWTVSWGKRFPSRATAIARLLEIGRITAPWPPELALGEDAFVAVQEVVIPNPKNKHSAWQNLSDRLSSLFGARV